MALAPLVSAPILERLVLTHETWLNLARSLGECGYLTYLVGLAVIETVLWLGSRDTLRKYYRRAEALMRENDGGEHVNGQRLQGDLQQNRSEIRSARENQESQMVSQIPRLGRRTASNPAVRR